MRVGGGGGGRGRAGEELVDRRNFGVSLMGV